MRYLKDIARFALNKKVFVGIDVHKSFWVVCVFCDGEVLEKRQLHKGYDELLALLSRYSGARSVAIVYEASFMGSWLYRRLKDDGYSAMITPPSLIPQDGSKVKTDKRDAEKLARYLAANILKSIYVLPAEAEADRSLIRRRVQIVKNRSRVKTQIRSLLNLHGLTAPEGVGNTWSKKYICWLESLDFAHSTWRQSLDLLLEEHAFLGKQVKQLNKALRELSRSSRYDANFERLCAAKGVGLITAMTFLLEVHNFSRFPSERHFSSMLGLSPSQHSSGEHVRMGHITRQGSAHLRRVLVECAWTVIRYDPHLQAKYERIRARGTNGKKAIVAVARSMAIRMRRCLLDEVPYDVSVC